MVMTGIGQLNQLYRLNQSTVLQVHGHVHPLSRKARCQFYRGRAAQYTILTIVSIEVYVRETIGSFAVKLAAD